MVFKAYFIADTVTDTQTNFDEFSFAFLVLVDFLLIIKLQALTFCSPNLKVSLVIALVCVQ